MDVFYAVKGGVGCSTIAAAFALQSARAQPTVLVDCSGDLDVLLGLRHPTEDPGFGLSDWLAAAEPPPDALSRLERPVSGHLTLIPFGLHATLHPDEARLSLLAALLERDGRRCIVDLGLQADGAASLLVDAATTVLVTRACYLGVCAARQAPTPDAVVVIREAGRALRVRDIEAALGAQTMIGTAWDPAVARSIDSGMAIRRLPNLLTELERLL